MNRHFILQNLTSFANPWLFVFFITFILFLILVHWRTLINNLWAGFVPAVHYLIIFLLIHEKILWVNLRVNEGLPKIFIFSDTLNLFFLGIVFMMGILFVQFLPKNFFLQLIHGSIWTFFFRLMLEIAQKNKMIHFNHFKVWMSFYIIPVNMLSLAWLSIIFNKRKHLNKDEDINRYPNK